MKKVNSQTTPIYRNSGFCFASPEDIQDAMATPSIDRADSQWTYSRYENPTVDSAERRLAGLEGGGYALLAPSGMAAIDIALSIFQKGTGTNKWMFFSELYGGTSKYINNVLIQRRGIDAVWINTEARVSGTAKMLEKAFAEHKPDLIYFESITNPMLTVPEAETIIRMAREAGVRVVVDNTFASPLLWKPLTDGADVVVHSATKYLAGHGDLMAGYLATNEKALWESAHDYRQFCGYIISPDDAYRLETYLQSFDCRMNCHIGNALRLAHFLTSNNSKIESVIYPGLPGDASHANAVKLFGEKGYGAIITFKLSGQERVQRRENLKKFAEIVAGRINIVPTLGNPVTTMLPVNEYWIDKATDEGLIRLSVGTEPYEIIEKTIKEALDSI